MQVPNRSETLKWIKYLAKKGRVENAISIIRRYFPKGTDLSETTQKEVDEIIWEINNRPRKNP